jgi:hypothetical protein
MKRAVYRYLFLVIIVFPLFINAQERMGSRPKREKQYNLEQATSERAQLHTLAFSGLAFVTGTYGADTFFPPGKVADFFGFQYMRDNDKNEKGHNTDFLTRIANNVIAILDAKQLKKMVELANVQAPIYDAFAQKRWVLIKAFRANLETKAELNKAAVIKYCTELYALDAELSYQRALVVGAIIHSLTTSQKEAFAKLQFDNSSTWPVLPETLDKRSLSHRAHVAVMTYASELFSWYAGSSAADIYFCPERHCTYFGGFYMKDFLAMGNPNYNISTALTGDAGRDFIAALTAAQSDSIHQALRQQLPLLKQIVKVRESVALELRKAIVGEIPDILTVKRLIQQYGALDGEMSYYACRSFSFINKTLTTEQKVLFVKLRNQSVFPKGVYLYSDPMDLPGKLGFEFLMQLPKE